MNIALRRVEDHQVKVVLTMRFLWGLRIALPVALGLTSMSARRFFWLNLFSASVWSCVFAVVGFGTSRVIARVFEDLHARDEMGRARTIAAGGAADLAALAWQFGRPRRLQAD